MNQRIVIITGMHRSGTSLGASILQKAGVNIGDNVIGPNESNPRGHFEDVDFFQFQENILNRLGQTIIVQQALDLNEITLAETDLAKRLIETHHDKQIWGWKDPRTCLFLDFWHTLLPQANYIFIYRHPLEVLLSLLRRGTDLEVLVDPLMGVRAWQVYNQAILSFYQQHPGNCFLANVSGIVENIEGFIEAVNEKFNLTLQTEGSATLYQATELKQVHIPPDTLDMLKQIDPKSVAIYEQLNNFGFVPHMTNGSPHGRILENKSEIQMTTSVWLALLQGTGVKWLEPYDFESSIFGLTQGEITTLANSPIQSKMENKRILMFLPCLTDGEAGRFNLNLVAGLTAKNYEIFICTTTQSDNPWQARFANFAPDIFHLPNSLELIDFPRFLLCLINSHQIETVFISSSSLGYQLLPFLHAYCPQVTFVDYIYLEEPVGYWKGGHVRISLNYQEILDLNVVSSQQLKQWMVERGSNPEQIEVCHTNIEPLDKMVNRMVELFSLANQLAKKSSRPLVGRRLGLACAMQAVECVRLEQEQKKAWSKEAWLAIERLSAEKDKLWIANQQLSNEKKEAWLAIERLSIEKDKLWTAHQEAWSAIERLSAEKDKLWNELQQ